MSIFHEGPAPVQTSFADVSAAAAAARIRAREARTDRSAVIVREHRRVRGEIWGGRLSGHQLIVLGILTAHYDEHGRGLTYSEVWKRSRVRHDTTVQSALFALERKGVVQVVTGKAMRFVPVQP